MLIYFDTRTKLTIVALFVFVLCSASMKDTEKSKLDEVPLGKHYMVFHFQIWTGKGRPICFMVARYCLAGLSARWLVMEIQHIIATLALYRFVVNSLGCDGATENRSALMQQLDLSLRDVFPDLFDDEVTGNERCDDGKATGNERCDDGEAAGNEQCDIDLEPPSLPRGYRHCQCYNMRSLMLMGK